MTSIVIPHYNLHDMLRVFCLPNLYLYSKDIEVIIVDNGSAKPLKLEGPFTIVRSDKRVSFASACNMGAARAKGDVVVFLNNDCQVLPGWLEAILETLKDTKTAVCGSKLLFPNGLLQHIGISFGRKRVPYHPGLGQDDRKYNYKRLEAVAVTGACMAVKKKVFVGLGGFHEGFKGGNYEDVDLCLSVRDAGYKVKVAMESTVLHLGGASYKEHPDEHNEILVRRNWEVLRERWNHKEDSFFNIGKKTLLLEREEAWRL